MTPILLAYKEGRPADSLVVLLFGKHVGKDYFCIYETCTVCNITDFVFLLRA